MGLSKSGILSKINVFLPKNEGNVGRIMFISNFVLLFAVLGAVGLNQILIARVNKSLGIKNNFIQRMAGMFSLTENFTAGENNLELTGDPASDAIRLVISSGLPAIYGQELGVSFDQVQQSMDIMKHYDPAYGDQKIVLAGENLNRYIDVGLRISCEYCCGAAAIIFKSGEAACGCAHSQAMRGLAAYLIQNHGTEYSNDEILRELARWKGMFFPKQMIQKLTEQRQGGQYSPDIAALLLGINLPAVSGAASGNAPLPSSIENLPSMVGGC